VYNITWRYVGITDLLNIFVAMLVKEAAWELPSET